MKCPQDADVDLVMTERQGVEIDYCPSCRGVWLDRGELDKILDRAAAQVSPGATPAAAPGSPGGNVPGEGGPGLGGGGYVAGGYQGSGYGSAGYDEGRPRGRYDDDRGRYDDGRRYDDDDRRRYEGDRDRHPRPGHDPRRKRKESWLGDLLDFG
jgi:hypothetical protein